MKNIHVLSSKNYKQDYTLDDGKIIQVVRLGQLILDSETSKLHINKNEHWVASCDTDILVPKHIYITSNEEIKEGDWLYRRKDSYETIQKATLPLNLTSINKKIILTTDQDLIKDGVQAIDDEFLEWFVKNPSCEEVEFKSEYLGSKCLKCGFIENHDEVDTEDCPKCHNTTYDHLYNQYKIIIPKEEPKALTKLEIAKNIASIGIGKKEEPKQESFNSKRGLKEVQIKDPNTCEYYKEVGCIKDICDCYTLVPKQETLEEAAVRISKKHYVDQSDYWAVGVDSFKRGAKWQQERMYSEEEVFELCRQFAIFTQQKRPSYKKQLEWFEQFKKQ